MSDETDPPVAAPEPQAKSSKSWGPVIAVLLLMPAISFGMTQYVLIPRIKGTFAEQGALAKAGTGKADAHGAKEASKGGHGKEGGKGEPASGKFSYDFDSVVVNLSGSMGSRYLKSSFTIFSTNPDLKKLIEENKKQLQDVAINILSSRTMADLETGGAKNVVRNDLI